MKYVYFKITALFPETGAAELNAFLSNHAVTSVSEQFVDDGQNSFWSVRVVVVENKANNQLVEPKPAKRGGVDYRELLSPEVFAIYAKLRSLRNHVAEQQSVPAYAVFTNEQLAEIAKLEHPTKPAIAAINGIGEKRLALYADQFIALLVNQDG